MRLEGLVGVLASWVDQGWSLMWLLGHWGLVLRYRGLVLKLMCNRGLVLRDRGLVLRDSGLMLRLMCNRGLVLRDRGLMLRDRGLMLRLILRDGELMRRLM
jgi:hypothetical protein